MISIEKMSSILTHTQLHNAQCTPTLISSVSQPPSVDILNIVLDFVNLGIFLWRIAFALISIHHKRVNSLGIQYFRIFWCLQLPIFNLLPYPMISLSSYENDLWLLFITHSGTFPFSQKILRKRLLFVSKETLFSFSFIKSIYCTARRLAVRQSRVRFSARHHREVFPTEHTSDEEMEIGFSEWRRMKVFWLNECMYVIKIWK